MSSLWLGLCLVVSAGLFSGGCLWLAHAVRIPLGKWTDSNDQVIAALGRVEKLLAMRTDTGSHIATFVNIDEDLDIPPREEAS